jgi:putative ABC transport system permease protein
VQNPHGKAEVVGIVGDTKHYGLDREPRAELFMPAWQQPLNGMALIVRTASDPNGFIETIRREVLAIDAEQPIYDVSSMVDVVSRSVFLPRISTLLLAAFAVSALLLAIVGIYGVVSYAAAQRTQEIGVRIALGAQRGDILQLVVGHGLRLVAVGITLGLAAAFALSRLLANLLFGISSTDPATFVSVPLILGAMAVVASYLPAFRATRVDPSVALRNE